MKKGFTLIELLVVVVIVGVLTAIALPQYTQSVERSRLAEAVPVMTRLAKGMAGRIASGGYKDAKGKDLINLQLTAGKWIENDYYQTLNFRYQFSCSSGGSCTLEVIRTSSEEPAAKDASYALKVFFSGKDNIEKTCYSYHGNKVSLTENICDYMETQGFEYRAK